MEAKKLILATLAYYDLFDFPLTIEEMKRYLVASDSTVTDEDIEKTLKELETDDKIISESDFYTLPKREHIVPLRLKKTRLAQIKLRRARRIVRLLAVLPFIKAVFACGSLALRNTTPQSDLDVFIITSSGRIWTARFFEIIATSLLGVRRKSHQTVAPDKLCPNHYITDRYFEITNHNMYSARIYLHLLPLYLENEKILEDFKNANSWMSSFTRSWPSEKNYLLKTGWLSKLTKWSAEKVLRTKFGDIVEKTVRKYQVSRIERNPKTREPNGRIKYGDRSMEFHPDSIESAVLKKFDHLRQSL